MLLLNYGEAMPFERFVEAFVSRGAVVVGRYRRRLAAGEAGHSQ